MPRERMEPALRAQLAERLSYRAARLAKVAAPEHPGSTIDAVLSLMATQVMKTAMVLLGEQFTRDTLRFVFDDFAESYGVCRFCHARPLRANKTMCQVCWDTASSDDEITDEELIAAAEDLPDEDSEVTGVEP